MKGLINLKNFILYKTWKNNVIIPVDYDFYDMLFYTSDLEGDD